MKPFYWNVLFFIAVFIVFLLLDFASEGSLLWFDNLVQAFFVTLIYSVGIWLVNRKRNKKST